MDHRRIELLSVNVKIKISTSLFNCSMSIFKTTTKKGFKNPSDLFSRQKASQPFFVQQDFAMNL